MPERNGGGPAGRGAPRRPAAGRWTEWLWICACAALAAAGPAVADDTRDAGDERSAHPLAAALELARASREAAKEVEDFEARFSKRDVVNGQMHAHSMDMKFRASPLSVYLKFNKPHEGREVLYVEGRNDDKLLAREAGLRGLVGTVALAPNSEQALSESRYPITRTGLATMVDGIIEQWEEESRYGETEVKYYPNARLRDMECTVIESSHPRPRRQFRFHVTRLYLDKETGLPVRVEQYGFPAAPDQPPPLLEEYTYWNIRTNVGLTDLDFDPRNPRYGF